MNLYEELHTKSVVLFSLCTSNHFLAKYRIKRYYMPNITKLWADGNYAKNWLFYIHIMWVSNFSFFISGKMGWKGKNIPFPDNFSCWIGLCYQILPTYRVAQKRFSIGKKSWKFKSKMIRRTLLPWSSWQT